HVFPKLKAVCSEHLNVEATREIKREILEDNHADLEKLMVEKGMTDEEALFDSLDPQDELLATGEGAWPSVDYYKEYIAIRGWGWGREPATDMIWTLYPRKDGDFIIFECLNGIVPFGVGVEEVTLKINACFQPKGCDGEWGRGTAFKLFPLKKVKLVGSATEEKGGPEGEEDNSTVSELSVPAVKIPLAQFYSLCIKGLRANYEGTR
ncbi:hypothetical protein HK104_004528, partial [Borealophlyctis nickersoniae]